MRGVRWAAVLVAVFLGAGLASARDASVRAAPPVARAGAAAADPLVEQLEDGIIDWGAGVITTTAGAAADLRMPSAATARAGSERRARAAARARLGVLLRRLPGGPRQPHLDAAGIDRAVGRATVDEVDYQSNGGVVLRMRCNFGDWRSDASPGEGVVPAAPAPAQASPAATAPAVRELSLSLAGVRLQAMPLLLVAGAPVSVRSARYRPAGSLPAGAHAIPAHMDPAGRLVLDEALSPRDVGDAAIVVYFQRLTR